jgi:hypothetical protein
MFVPESVTLLDEADAIPLQPCKPLTVVELEEMNGIEITIEAVWRHPFTSVKVMVEDPASTALTNPEEEIVAELELELIHGLVVAGETLAESWEVPPEIFKIPDIIGSAFTIPDKLIETLVAPFDDKIKVPVYELLFAPDCNLRYTNWVTAPAAPIVKGVALLPTFDENVLDVEISKPTGGVIVIPVVKFEPLIVNVCEDELNPEHLLKVFKVPVVEMYGPFPTKKLK